MLLHSLHYLMCGSGVVVITTVQHRLTNSQGGLYLIQQIWQVIE